jgi:histone-lysine N-methyltransferase SETD1
VSFDPQIDRENGSALGIIFIKFMTHEEAKFCLDKENGRKGGLMGISRAGEVEEWKVVFDGDGSRLAAVMKALEDAKKVKSKPLPTPVPGHLSAVQQNATPGSSRDVGTPRSGANSPPGRRSGSHQHSSHSQGPPQNNARVPSGLPNRVAPPYRSAPGPPQANLPQKPSADVVDQSIRNEHGRPHPNSHANGPTQPPTQVRHQNIEKRLQILQAEEEARARAKPKDAAYGYASAPLSTSMNASRNLPSRGRKYGGYQASPMSISRSPSPAAVRNPALAAASTKSAADKEKDHQEVVRLLAENGHDHVKIQGSAQLIMTVTDAQIRQFFYGFDVEKVCIFL